MTTKEEIVCGVAWDIVRAFPDEDVRTQLVQHLALDLKKHAEMNWNNLPCQTALAILEKTVACGFCNQLFRNKKALTRHTSKHC